MLNFDERDEMQEVLRCEEEQEGMTGAKPMTGAPSLPKMCRDLPQDRSFREVPSAHGQRQHIHHLDKLDLLIVHHVLDCKLDAEISPHTVFYVKNRSSSVVSEHISVPTEQNMVINREEWMAQYLL